MKGGKEGRKRKSADGAKPAARGKTSKSAAKNAVKRPGEAAPKKGSRKKAYGAVPKDDE